MTRRTVTRHVVAIYCNARPGKTHGGQTVAVRQGEKWYCRRCGARVKVVA